MAGDGEARVRVINCPVNVEDMREEGGSFFSMEAHMTVCGDALSCTDVLSIKSHLLLQSHLTRSGGLADEMKALAGTKDKVHDGNIYICC